jgi:hypothetical protein
MCDKNLSGAPLLTLAAPPRAAAAARAPLPPQKEQQQPPLWPAAVGHHCNNHGPPGRPGGAGGRAAATGHAPAPSSALSSALSGRGVEDAAFGLYCRWAGPAAEAKARESLGKLQAAKATGAHFFAPKSASEGKSRALKQGWDRLGAEERERYRARAARELGAHPKVTGAAAARSFGKPSATERGSAAPAAKRLPSSSSVQVGRPGKAAAAPLGRALSLPGAGQVPQLRFALKQKSTNTWTND